MCGVRFIRSAALFAALLAMAWAALAGWSLSAQAQDGDQAQAEPERRRTARLVRPWSDLDDLTPRQEATIREIRADILNQKDELDRQERQRIMDVLTEAQRKRVAEIEAERARQQEERRQRNQEEQDATTRSSGGNGEDN